MDSKEVEITIDTDGIIEIEQTGWSGKSCEGAVDDLIHMLGKEVHTKKNKDWHKRQKIEVHQHRTV